MTQQRVYPEKVAEFLSEPRTTEELASWFKVDRMSPMQAHSLPLPEGYAMFEQHDKRGRPSLSVWPQGEAPKGREWALRVNDHNEPYLWVQFPRQMTRERLRISPLSDVHYGAKAHSAKRFKKVLKEIEEDDDVFTFLNGDILENAIDGSIGGAVYESILTPDEQLWGAPEKGELGIIELLRPIAHKILWCLPGNHEWRTWKTTNLDPLKVVCRQLNIPYFSEPVYADILAWGHRFTFYCHHGTTGSNTKGGKLNAASKPAEFQEAVDFVVMGHVHDSMANPVSRMVRKRMVDSLNRVQQVALEERPQHIVICPSFHGFFGSYGSRAGYSPGSWGSVNCTLFQDGRYRASE